MHVLQSHPQAKPTVLLVDDTPEILAIIQSLLCNTYQVITASNGLQCLQIAQSEPTPDLILLDIVMPEMDGYEVCIRLKGDPKTRDIPVIFLTSRSDVENEERGFAVGAVDYLTKPVGSSVLLARVKTHIAAHAQRKSLEGMFKDVIEFAPVIFLIADDAHRIVRTNAMAEKHLGYLRNEMAGMPVQQVLPQAAPYMSAITAELQTQPGEARVDANPELVCIRKDGSRFPGSATFGQLQTPHGLLHTVVLVNVEDKKDTLHKLHASQNALRDLVAANESARENERKTVAREVHDELGQVMTALRMRLSLMPMQFGAHIPQLGENVEVMKALVDRAIKGVRNITTVLRPEALDFGLIPALEWLRDEFQRHSAVRCTLAIGGHAQAVDDTRAMLIYRIVQEALTNVSRYAKASEVRIDIVFVPGSVGVRVGDNGCGFDPGEAMLKKTFGLLGMRERALTLGTELQIDSGPGVGTSIAVKVPI